MCDPETMLPEFNEDGNLPPGIHHATFSEVIERFGGRTSLISLKRQTVTQHLVQLYEFVKDFAIGTCIDGSYVTSKLEPGDVDLVLDLPSDFVFTTTIERKMKQFQEKMHIFRFIRGLEVHEQAREQIVDGFIQDRPGKPPKGIVYVEMRNDQE